MTYYSPEVELAIVSLCWHEPLLLPKVLQALDPQVHISQPHLRTLLETLNLVYGELGATDWATVIDTLRQQGKLEDCGELIGLDEIYRLEPCPSLLGYYIELLKDYSALREGQQPAPTLRFSGGQAQISNNKAKRTERDPEVIGEAIIDGRRYRVDGRSAANRFGESFLALRFYAKR